MIFLDLFLFFASVEFLAVIFTYWLIQWYYVYDSHLKVTNNSRKQTVLSNQKINLNFCVFPQRCLCFFYLSDFVKSRCKTRTLNFISTISFLSYPSSVMTHSSQVFDLPYIISMQIRDYWLFIIAGFAFQNTYNQTFVSKSISFMILNYVWCIVGYFLAQTKLLNAKLGIFEKSKNKLIM